ncbi:4-hydroxy-tetrahydrodipicolinate synthase [Cohaesibacter sp. ES.047]|uniref:dihydrodipicolinate synthase family protein n=1 Tax=Cohaesibacter sp. ES.047 TaxID=1798205 RepID=UPI000BB7CCCD|nr:dihydrodipicolinate synthase family protein [Cohaesibacter sp. ES.047]SNY92713.1 4-hydroxy-tetrahydrodipicolinate synthase [Cohaesibacter sp. ES.047]
MTDKDNAALEHHSGVWPVMLTPFTDTLEIDWKSLEKLIDWYIDCGVHGLFANCQSSEMFFLSEEESLKLTKFVVDHANGRVPVVASGHTASSPSHQAEQLQAQAETGVDSVIMISNRLATADESGEVFLRRLQDMTAQIPEKVGVGLYECPYPYKRLLPDEAVKWCAQSGRYTFIKDTCCDPEMLKRRAKLVEGSELHIANANAQTVLESLKAGCHGYSGVMANFHPQLWVWLLENWKTEPEKAETLSQYLTSAAMLEALDYPVCAKSYQKSIGNFATDLCRTRPTGGYYANHFPTTVAQTIALGEKLAEMLGLDVK